MKKKEKTYHNVGTFPKSNRKFVEIEAISVPLTHKYMTASLVSSFKTCFMSKDLVFVHDTI